MKTELLMPAGNPEKLKFALMYGADACYIGGKVLSLRAQASNFTMDDIQEACLFAHERGKKVYVTVNVIPRASEISLVKDYLIELEKIGVDGIIVSSPSILKIAKDNTNLHISLSTQASASNLNSVEFYKNKGIHRVVLSRELSLDEIEYIRNNTDEELEVFIHGGMCSAWSGRCSLSNYMSLRDANSGGCAHSCRWYYDIYKNNEKINTEIFKIGAKDLCAIPQIERLVKMGIDSLKVEGRMKSVSYVSTVAYTYRRLIDDIYDNQKRSDDYYLSLLGESVNRESSTGLIDGINDESKTLYSKESSLATQGFYAVVLDYDKNKKEALVEVRNYFEPQEEVEVLSPGEDIKSFTIKYIKRDGEIVPCARHALDKVIINSDIKLKKYDIIRRKAK